MMKSLPQMAACAALGAFLTACGSMAVQHADRFYDADANRDGKLSLDEANSYLVTPVFKSHDHDHDGKVTMAEWSGSDSPGAKKDFDLRDANHDGAVTLQEALDYGKKSGTAAKLMKAADTDKDGSLSRAEVTAYDAKHEGSPR
jgi:hypothetical protein